MQITRKKTLLYVERDERARTQCQGEPADLDPDALVDLDESGVDEAFHRAPLLAPMRFEGYCDTEVFNAWLEQGLLPERRPGQTVLTDHASFHKSATTKTLIESRGCHLKYLPTYSPALNPIEPQWAILKARLRKHHQPHQALGKALDTIFAMS